MGICRIQKNYFLLALFVFVFFPSCLTGFSLNGAKGKVLNILSKKGMENVDIVATATSDIESEQKYLHYSTKTDADGNFKIMGLPGKRYEVLIRMPGFTQKKISVNIPQESTRLLKNPIFLCPIPPKNGVFVYSNEFKQIVTQKPVYLFNTPKECCGNKSLYIKKADIDDIEPVKGDFLILHGAWTQKIEKMYWLFRRTKITNLGDAEKNGDFYTLGDYYGQSAETFCSFELSEWNKQETEIWRSSGYSGKKHFWGKLGCVYKDDQLKLAVFKLDTSEIPKGYYYLGEENRYGLKNTSPYLVLLLQ